MARESASARRLAGVALSAALLLVACRGGNRADAGAGAPPAAALTAPSAEELEARLGGHAAHRFDAAAQARGCPADQSLGAYVDMLVRYGRHGDAPGDIHRLTASCEEFPVRREPLPLDPPASADHWSCRIDAYTSDPARASPWHYELRLRVRKRDGAPDLDHLACPGAS